MAQKTTTKNTFFLFFPFLLPFRTLPQPLPARSFAIMHASTATFPPVFTPFPNVLASLAFLVLYVVSLRRPRSPASPTSLRRWAKIATHRGSPPLSFLILRLRLKARRKALQKQLVHRALRLSSPCLIVKVASTLRWGSWGRFIHGNRHYSKRSCTTFQSTMSHSFWMCSARLFW